MGATGTRILSFRDDEWGETGLPSCPPAERGAHWFSTVTENDTGIAQYYQTLTADAGKTYTLSGFFANHNEGDKLNSIRLTLRDGDATADVMTGASAVVVPPGQSDWTFGYIEGTATGSLMTAAWEVEHSGSEEGPKAAWVDDLLLEECVQPVTITSVDPVAVPNDVAGPHTLTITGSGFSGATPEVIFSTQGQVLTATSVVVQSDSTLTCEVNDLPAPMSVAFDVFVRSNGCIDSLAEGFVSAQTSIVNAQFEEPAAPLQCDPRTPIVSPAPSYWNFSDQLIREGDVFPPPECPLLSCACPELMEGCSGGHYASMSTGEGEDEIAWQTMVVTPGSGMIFGGWFSWGGTGAVNIKLVDGYGPDGAVLGTTSIPQDTDWCYYSVEGFATSPLVTVVWELVDTAEGAPAAVHADGLTFEFSPCHDPFADTDQDGDVDQLDFAFFQICFSGSGNPFPEEPSYCSCLDVEGWDGNPDGDIDSADLVLFEDCASGPDVPADTTCDDN
jgi:hypothetical protein